MFQYMDIWGRVWQGSLIVKILDKHWWWLLMGLSCCPPAMFLCQTGHSLEGLRSKFKGRWKCECRGSGTGETFRIPICNWGSCVYCLNKALIWLSIEGLSLLFGSEYCRWTIFLFAWVFACFCFFPKEPKTIKHGQQFFLHKPDLAC